MPQNKHHQSEEATLLSEMFETVAENAPLGIIVIQEGVVLYANSELAKLIEYPLAELQEMKANDFLKFVADADKVEANRLLKSAEHGEVKTKLYELGVKDKKGGYRWLQVLPRMISIQGKQAILAMVTETTEHKRIEQAYRDLVDHSLQGIIIIQDMKVIFANQAFADISGYSIEELLALSPKEVEASVHPDYQARVWGRMRDRLEGKPVPSHY